MESYTYLFPYEKIPKGTRILIYGAGDVGQAYLRQMKMTGYAEVVGMVDKAWERYPKMIVPLYPPEKVMELSFDFIVLAFKIKNFAEDVRSVLVHMGVPAGKILYEGARNPAGSVLVPAESVGQKDGWRVRYAFEEPGLSIALKYGPGLGDAIIRKKVFEAIARLAPTAKIDIYAPNASKMMPLIYRNEPCFHAAIDDGGAVYVDNHEKYGLSMSIFYMVQLDHVKYAVLQENSPALADAARKIEAANKAYKLSIYPITQNWIHFGRAMYRGWNCYTLYNYTGALDIQGQNIAIPLDSAAEAEFRKLGLGRYITVNFGNGVSSKGNQQLVSKQWPKEYFERYLEGMHQRFPGLTIVQIGDRNALELVGADRRILGQSLEVAKYVLKHSLLHLDIEGGLMHLATQLGTKCIALYGPTQVELFSYPQNINIVAETCRGCYTLYENSYACARGLDRPECMYSITPERVLAAAENYLEGILS